MLRSELDAYLMDAAQAEALPRLTEITDDTSHQVTGQYSQDPYPRWLSSQTPEPASAKSSMRGNFTTDALTIIDSPCDILIAGAGTGRQA